MREGKSGALGERSFARRRSFGATAVTGEGCRQSQSHQRALNRNDGDKRMNPPQMMPLVVPHVQPTESYHILLLAHHRVTTEVRACRHRNSPRVYAPERKICRTKGQVGPPIRDECQTERIKKGSRR